MQKNKIVGQRLKYKKCRWKEMDLIKAEKMRRAARNPASSDYSSAPHEIGALEQGQNLQDSILSMKGNISSSNDPGQLKQDMNDLLIRGAEGIGAGRLVGMEDTETLELLDRTTRRRLAQ